jgi:serine/threonine protein kinase
VLTAIAYMHAQGIMHRDLKLENLMFQVKRVRGKR